MFNFADLKKPTSSSLDSFHSAEDKFLKDTGFDFMDLITNKDRLKSYYEQDQDKDLTEYTSHSKELFDTIKPIRDKAIDKVLVSK